MKLLLLILIILGFLSCRQVEDLDKYRKSLPDSALINDVISTVIKLDSMNLDYGINKKIYQIKVVKPPEGDSIPMIPPPPPDGIYYNELFSLFESDNSMKTRIQDSIFISLQSDTIRKFNISQNIFSKFKDESYNEYRFLVPIFSYDKQYVYLEYSITNGYEASIHGIVLKWTGQDWSKKLDW